MKRQTGKEPSPEAFESLCSRICEFMNEKAKADPDYYLSKGAQKLEPEVKAAFDEVARGTEFEGEIEMIGGQRFPDIVVAKRFGIEVKSTKSDKWTMIGGSVAEGTRVEGADHIFILFGKLGRPAEFRMRRYEECLCDIAVTHSPRYKIDMELERGNTIFDKMGVPYDALRMQKNPIDPVVKYFRSTLKKGESLWWINGEDAAKNAAPAKIRMWKTLSRKEREERVAQGFALFPELFGRRQDKYERFTLWLVANHGVVSSSMRDPFSAGGQDDLEINGHSYRQVPRKYIQLSEIKNRVKQIVTSAGADALSVTWRVANVGETDRMRRWTELVARIAEEDFDVSQFLEDLFFQT